MGLPQHAKFSTQCERGVRARRSRYFRAKLNYVYTHFARSHWQKCGARARGGRGGVCEQIVGLRHACVFMQAAARLI